MVDEPDRPTATRADVTGLLAKASEGDRLATQELVPLVYEELRRLAQRYLSHEPPGHTLQPTALVHEAYVRLVGPGEITWENRRHFLGAAAKAIRRILTDHTRTKRRVKRGAGAKPVELEEDALVVEGLDFDILDLDQALERLARLHPQKAELVELRFFGGLSMEEIGQAFGLSQSTVAREWRFARAWLHRELADEQQP